MSNLNPPPIQQPILESTGLLTLQWILFLNALYDGDTGTAFTPVDTSLGSIGTPTLTGVYYRDGQFIDFYIYIVPATSTTSTAGTTYFDLPFDVKQDDACLAAGNLGAAVGMVTSSNNRVYPPAWAGAAYPITIRARVLAT